MTKDVNSNYLKLARSNSRLTNTLKKLLPRRKSSKHNTSEVNVNGIYNNNKYIIKVNNESKETKPAWLSPREEAPRQKVGRNKSFLLGAGPKVKRSNSVLPGFLSPKQVENRTVVEVGGPEQFPWREHEMAKPPNTTATTTTTTTNNNNIR